MWWGGSVRRGCIEISLFNLRTSNGSWWFTNFAGFQGGVIWVSEVVSRAPLAFSWSEVAPQQLPAQVPCTQNSRSWGHLTQASFFSSQAPQNRRMDEHVLDGQAFRLFVQPSQLQLQCQNMYKIMLGNEHLQASSWKVEKDTMDWLAVASFVCTRKRLMHANSKHPQKSSVVELAMGDVLASSCCECGLYNRGNHPCTQVPTPQQFRAKSWAEHTARRFFVDRVATRHPFSGSRVLDFEFGLM